MTFEHQDKTGNSFIGTLYQINGSWGTLQIHTAEETAGKQFDILGGPGSRSAPRKLGLRR